MLKSTCENGIIATAYRSNNDLAPIAIDELFVCREMRLCSVSGSYLGLLVHTSLRARTVLTRYRHDRVFAADVVKWLYVLSMFGETKQFSTRALCARAGRLLDLLKEATRF